jgi:uncharacterized protein YigE (DUF2233 family)
LIASIILGLFKANSELKSNTLKLFLIILFVAGGIFLFKKKESANGEKFVNYTVDVKERELKFYWKDDKNKNFGSILNLKSWLERNNIGVTLNKR